MKINIASKISEKYTLPNFSFIIKTFSIFRLFDDKEKFEVFFSKGKTFISSLLFISLYNPFRGVINLFKFGGFNLRHFKFIN